jgi:hypothetical protein
MDGRVNWLSFVALEMNGSESMGSVIWVKGSVSAMLLGILHIGIGLAQRRQDLMCEIKWRPPRQIATAEGVALVPIRNVDAIDHSTLQPGTAIKRGR